MLKIENPIIAVAPMIDWTDRHDRYFLRLISKRVQLYTEMITAPALVYGDTANILQYHESEHPVVLQLGGSDPVQLAYAAKQGQMFGYDEINLNLGCPSDRVQAGRFGACMMGEPDAVKDCLIAMQDAVGIPVTAKTRIGIDEHESYDYFADFIQSIVEAGVTRVTVHARNAWLKGLSPKENREIPPLKYDYVYRLKRERPDLIIAINGGITDWMQADEHLNFVDGVMLGRKAYQDPYCLAEVDQRYYGEKNAPLTREQVVEAMMSYISEQGEQGIRPYHILRHMLGLFSGQKNGRLWRRVLSEKGPKTDSGEALLAYAMEVVETGQYPVSR